MKKRSGNLTSRFQLWVVMLLSLILLFGCDSLTGSSDDDDDGGTTSGDSGGGGTDDRDTSLYSDLESYQWHLVNTGQTAFSSQAGTAGEDINQESTHAEGITGDGIIVAVIDTGLELAHEDLDANVIAGASWDFVGLDNDPTNSSTDGDHGTSVAGLIASEDNQIGGRGVAPGASLKGFNYLVSNQTLADFLDAIGGSSSNPASDDVDIFNLSLGTELNYDYKINSTVEAQLVDGVTNLRGGKGAIYVKSAGNGFREVDDMSCTAANDAGLTCQNSNMDAENATPWAIIAGSLDATGVRASYSTAGSATWISAPGGEYGVDESLGWSADSEVRGPAMITTDQSGCDSGYAKTSDETLYNEFEDNNNELNYYCDFTSTFNGTSSAAPVVSGVVALMLEANPNLTWRDIKHILAATARKVDSSQSGVDISVNSQTYSANLGWVTNSASYDFHNWYGFGAVDGDAAVTMAKTYSSNWGVTPDTSSATSGTISVAIPDNDKNGATSTLNIGDDYTIEAVQVTVSLTHSYVGDIGIELLSPSGTRSVLFNVLNGFGNDDDLDGMVLLSNAFYGESSIGNWELKMIDADASISGTLTEWTIKVYGH